MAKPNYKELWEQLLMIVICEVRRSWPNTKLLSTMTILEKRQQYDKAGKDVQE